MQHVFVVWLQVPPGHVPHVTWPPHPSSNVPHWKVEKSAHVAGEHGGPQTPFELQTSPDGHCPQLMLVPLHTLRMDPQFSPSATHSTGVAVGLHWLATPWMPHPCPAGQPKPITLSQSTIPPQPFETMPH